jgi:hypothetical protein
MFDDGHGGIAYHSFMDAVGLGKPPTVNPISSVSFQQDEDMPPLPPTAQAASARPASPLDDEEELVVRFYHL